jgi:hypothetical protein
MEVSMRPEKAQIFLDGLKRRGDVNPQIRAYTQAIVEGLIDRHKDGYRVYGMVIYDPRVSDKLLLDVNDHIAWTRYELPAEKPLDPGMFVCGILDFSLYSHFKGINAKGEPVEPSPGAIRPGTIRFLRKPPLHWREHPYCSWPPPWQSLNKNI